MGFCQAKAKLFFQIEKRLSRKLVLKFRIFEKRYKGIIKTRAIISKRYFIFLGTFFNIVKRRIKIKARLAALDKVIKMVRITKKIKI